MNSVARDRPRRDGQCRRVIPTSTTILHFLVFVYVLLFVFVLCCNCICFLESYQHFNDNSTCINVFVAPSICLANVSSWCVHCLYTITVCVCFSLFATHFQQNSVQHFSSSSPAIRKSRDEDHKSSREQRAKDFSSRKSRQPHHCLTAQP